MIDSFAILVSTLMAVYAVWRAYKLDGSQPWFSATALEDSTKKPLRKKDSPKSIPSKIDLRG